MNYNFDEIVNREGTNCVKYDFRKMYFGNEDVLPLWVADMDFKTPDFIINALRQRLDHEILGYTFRSESYYSAIINWMKTKHNWDIRENWISYSPGVVAGLTLSVEAFSEKGDEVILQPPVYNPFFDSINMTERKLVENPLKIINGRYTFDFDDLKRKITDKTKLLFLCNPHNPGGMVWTKDELNSLADICLERGVMVISDEIHSDLVFEGHKHIPFASLSEEAANNSVVCMAGSKTFNIAGLTTSFLVIPNKENFVKYERILHIPHLHMGNILGHVALEAAYTEGSDWLWQLMIYLKGNYDFVEDYLKGTRIVPMKPEATYMVWLDFSSYGLPDDELNKCIIGAGVGLNRGVQFGKQGSGYMRLNIGCPRSVVEKALERIVKVLESS